MTAVAGLSGASVGLFGNRIHIATHNPDEAATQAKRILVESGFVVEAVQRMEPTLEDVFHLLSGFVFPIANMPVVVQWITLVNPLRYFLEIIRGIFLKGVGISILWPQFVRLALLGPAVLWLATRRFRKTLA